MKFLIGIIDHDCEINGRGARWRSGREGGTEGCVDEERAVLARARGVGHTQMDRTTAPAVLITSHCPLSGNAREAIDSPLLLWGYICLFSFLSCPLRWETRKAWSTCICCKGSAFITNAMRNITKAKGNLTKVMLHITKNITKEMRNIKIMRDITRVKNNITKAVRSITKVMRNITKVARNITKGNV